MGEIPDIGKKIKKLKKKLEEAEPEMFEKREVGVLEGSAHSGKKKRKRK
jgi:hypothetical protein